MKMRDILKKYPEQKALSLVKRLKEKGMFYYDEDFPGDEEEIYFYIGEGNVLKDKNSTSESQKVTLKEAGKELAQALTSEGAPLENGALPAVPAASDSGAKALLEAVASGSAVATKAKPNRERTTPDKATPKTLAEPLDCTHAFNASSVTFN